MIKLQLKSQEERIRYPSDVRRIVEVFADRGYEISYAEAAHAWEQHSESYAAGWLILPEDDSEVYSEIAYLFETVE